ncbi:hypothetical protein SAMN05444747_120109 [Variovorax sp. OV329]|nr:hypothetical protein SAMN05444747_120109 [Variovorax sp. OV329]
MHSAIAVLAVGLVLACVGSLAYVVRQHKVQQAALAKEDGQAPGR